MFFFNLDFQAEASLTCGGLAPMSACTGGILQ